MIGDNPTFYGMLLEGPSEKDSVRVQRSTAHSIERSVEVFPSRFHASKALIQYLNGDPFSGLTFPSEIEAQEVRSVPPS